MLVLFGDLDNQFVVCALVGILVASGEGFFGVAAPAGRPSNDDGYD